MTPPIRSVEVRPPSRSGELLGVLRASGAIVIVALFTIALRRDGGSGLREQDLAPFQRLFRDVDPDLQRAYSQIQEGLVEAENLRSATSSWPSPEILAALDVPPFAEDPIAKIRYGWTLAQGGNFVNYRGRSDSPGSMEFLALIQEPPPGDSEIIGPQSPPDETHHVLSDGTVLHVTVWFRPAGAPLDEGLVTRPFAEGFFQILAGTSP